MFLAAAILTLCIFALADIVGADTVPSGEPMQLHEVLIDEVGPETWVRFRFIAPTISRDVGRVKFADVEPDFDHLCRRVVLPYISEYGVQAQVAVITLLDRPVAFGSVDHEATQFIESFRISSGDCEWEAF